MAIPKIIRDLQNLMNYATDDQPTTQQAYQEAVRNWVKTIESVVDIILWQPTTEYTVGNQVKTPNLPSQYVLVCTVAGTSGSAEPVYGVVGLGDIITDGTAKWKLAEHPVLTGGSVALFVNGKLQFPDGSLMWVE